MQRIGPGLELASASPDAMAWQHRGDYRALGLCIFLALLAGLFYWFELEFAAAFNALLSGLLSLLTIANGLYAWDLTLDFARREYRVSRGSRLYQRKVTGGFGQLNRVVLALSSVGDWRHYLVQQGSERGYEIAHFKDREDARREGRQLAARLGVALVEELLKDETPLPAIDLRTPPPGVPIKVTAFANGLEFDLSPHPLMWREWVRFDSRGLETGVDLLLPFGRRNTSSQRVSWRDVTQVMVGGVSRDDGGIGFSPYLRLRPDWRAHMRQVWAWHCAENRWPARTLPWYGFIWYCWEDHPFLAEKCVDVYRNRGVRFQFGASSRVTRPGIEWLARAIAAKARRHGARLTESA